jgi:hypothetical protein
MKPKPTIGQTLFSLNVGNTARRGVEQKLTKMTVTKVGSKYFYCVPEGWRTEVCFRISDWRENTEFCSNHHLYETEQQYLDEKEAADIFSWLRESYFAVFAQNKLTLEQLKAIKQLLIAQ